MRRAIQGSEALQKVGLTNTDIGLAITYMVRKKVAFAPSFAKNKSKIDVSIRMMIGRVWPPNLVHQ
jgi:hypothetical protein